ncbi:class I SAM-dependent DNA methyltransferase [Kineococcus terrestris]|uniref:class I SAM-dependent DNA methyltransferase n=1 Tax=Kineococcus terrestris TaxID=2044856 RepID=UPI0034DB572C
MAPDEPPDLAAVRHAYDTVASDYATHLPDVRAESSLELAVLDAFAEAVTAGVAAGAGPVLDAGCGTGRITRYLAERGCAVEGVDLSPGMVAEARRHHPGHRFTVGTLTDLPHPPGGFAGVVLWYSVIHTRPEDHPRVFAEVARVLRPGGHVVVAFQSGEGVRDVSAAYRRLGHDVRLERYLVTADEVAAGLRDVGLREECRLVRRPRGAEQDDQAVVLAQAV